MVNYVELINHYALPEGNGGFERYQCFRVISLLLRTRIQALLSNSIHRTVTLSV